MRSDAFALAIKGVSPTTKVLVITVARTARGCQPLLPGGNSTIAGVAGNGVMIGGSGADKLNGASERGSMNQTGHKSQAMLRKYMRSGELVKDNAAGIVGLYSSFQIN